VSTPVAFALVAVLLAVDITGIYEVSVRLRPPARRPARTVRNEASR
jgi:hypothetical protein